MPTMNADTQTIIWNRAANQHRLGPDRDGHTALAGVLRLHSMIMSGGPDHALNVFAPQEFIAAASGFRNLNLSEVGGVVEDAHRSPADELLEELDARCKALMTIAEQLEIQIHQHPTTSQPRPDTRHPRWGQNPRRQPGPDHLTRRRPNFRRLALRPSSAAVGMPPSRAA